MRSTLLVIGAALLVGGRPSFCEPHFLGPLTRSPDGTQLTAYIRDYPGEIRERAAYPPSWKFTGSALVDIPVCEAGQFIGDMICTWPSTQDWLVAASVDGGVTWLAEDTPPLPGSVLATLLQEEGGSPDLEWKLPMVPIVRSWEFQRAIPQVNSVQGTTLAWQPFDELDQWSYCVDTTLHDGSHEYRCLRTLPSGEYLYRVRGCNQAGCGGWGQEPYAVCVPLSQGIPGIGGCPCFWPDNGACVP